MTAPIIPGAEPWSSTGGSHGVLVLHGFTGNPQSMRPLAEAVAAAGFTVDLPLLPGHGTAVEDMVPTRWEDWSAAAEAAYQALAARCDKVVVAGLSMGGTLTCWLAEQHPEIAGIAVVNPLVEPPTADFLDGIRGLLDAGTEVIDGIGSDIAKEGAVEAAYPGTPLAAALSLFEGVATVKERLGAIHCPTLLLNSREDHVVDPVSGDVLEASVGGPVERVYLERSFHVATLDWDAPLIEERVVGFVDEVLSGPGAAAHLMAGPDRLTRAEVAHVAALARLDLTEEELDLFTGQLAQVLDHAADVSSLDLAGVAPTAHAMAVTNVLRPDELQPCLDRDEVLAQAPSVEDHRFRVPRILGDAP